MATSKERVKKWQAKTKLKADIFTEQDNRRRRALQAMFNKATGHLPALKVVRAMFLPHPRCFYAPECIADENGTLVVKFPAGNHFNSAWEETLAALALLDAGYADVAFDFGGGRATTSPQDYYYGAARGEIAKLKELGIWSSNEDNLGARSIVAGA